MYELQVEGMSCGHCVATVTKLVRQLDRDAKVEVDLARKKVRVDSIVPPEVIAKTLTDDGYPANAG